MQTISYITHIIYYIYIIHITHTHHSLIHSLTYLPTYRVSDGVEVAPDLVLAPVSWVDIHCGQSPIYKAWV